MSSSSLSGRRLGAYDVGPLIGVGGMGEVYRARDSKLNRDVAIKILLAAVAADVDRLARFRREAQVLASLNHPNIAHIHGIEEGEAGPFLVMELIEGPTLADRIALGPIAIDEALAIARQIADALEAAHERGVVHRDLKPANIKVSDDGAVKVLDFGLAKALDPPEATASSAAQPTITTPAMTGAGMILGTAAYMSPEQAKGRVVDKRTDVWAFGCVFYEMLTAKRAFDGEDVTDTIAAVVRGEPDWNALPAETPPQVRLLLKRCLEKDRRARVSDISVARFLMNEPLAQTVAIPATPASKRSLIGAAAIGALAAALVLVLVAWRLRPQPVDERPARFEMLLPSAPLQGTDHDLAISSDGARIAFRGGGPQQSQLYVRDFDSLDARPLAATSGGRSPFFSPDGQWIGFFAGRELRKVSLTGGPAIPLCQLDGQARGGSWGDDDTIIFATQNGVLRVRAGGGEPEQLIEVVTSSRVEGARFPLMLPGSQAFLFTSGTRASSQVEAFDLKTGARKVLIRGGSDAAYTHTGHLIFAVVPEMSLAGDVTGAASLRAVGFDATQLEVTSDQVPVAENVLAMAGGSAQYALSENGTLVFFSAESGDLSSRRRRSLVWVNRQGREEPLSAPQREYGTARISPDGARVVLDLRDEGIDIWIWDLKRATLTPLNRDPAQDFSPLWTPDGKRILWTSTRGGNTPNLYRQSADGTGAIERLTQNGNSQFPTSISPDGSQVIFFGLQGQTMMDLFSVSLADSDRKPRTLVQSQAMDVDGELSPDGRWLAYHSNESGTAQVLVRPYPDIDSGRSQISTTGGTRPAWSRNGRELFYLDENEMLTSVPIQTKGDSLSAGTPTRLLKTRYYAGQTILGLDLRAYDVSPDGSRFLMIKETEPPNQQTNLPQGRLVVVMNWFTELKQRLQPK